MPHALRDRPEPGRLHLDEDEVLGGTMYWRAPKAVRKQAADALGGSLAFSLRQQSAGTRPFDEDDVILEGGPATRRDMKVALKSLNVLTIRAEYEAGEDTDDLDTVVLKSASRK